MIVFLYMFIFIFIITIIFLFSNIKIIIKDMVISDSNNLSNIIKILIKEKDERKKMNLLDYINLNIKIKLIFLNKIPILSIKLNNKKIKNILLKQYEKEIKNNKDIEKDKKKAKKLLKKIIPRFMIEKMSLNLTLGTDDAAFTAIVTSIISIIIAVFIPYVVEEQKIKECKYYIEPRYLGKNVFFLQFNCIITSKIVHIIKVICKKEEDIK